MFARLKRRITILGGKDPDRTAVPVIGEIGDLALVIRPGGQTSDSFYTSDAYEIILHGRIGYINGDALEFLRDSQGGT